MAVRCTSQVSPFHTTRSVFSLCWQMACWHISLATP